MDEFLSGLTNYTEKENPYHIVDAYPGTDFYNTENILKLFYPLVVFHLHQEFRILCNHKVIGIDELRYYLNYVIIPRVSQYWKQTPTKSDMLQEYYEEIKEALDKLVLVSHELSDILDRIKVYLRTIRYAFDMLEQMLVYINDSSLERVFWDRNRVWRIRINTFD